MRTLKYTFWQDGEFFLGYLNDYPDYQTQADAKDELLENLRDLLADLESGNPLHSQSRRIGNCVMR